MFISESKKRGMVAHFSGHESRQVLPLPNKTGKALAYSCKDPAESRTLKSKMREVIGNSQRSKQRGLTIFCRLVLANSKVAMVGNSNSDPDLRNARRFRDDQPV